MTVTALKLKHRIEIFGIEIQVTGVSMRKTLPGFPLFAMAARISVPCQGWPQEGTGKPFIS